MPIYEYECQQCGHRLDHLQKVDEPPLVVCPNCGKDSLQKCISMPSFQLKGSGWYETDYRNKEKKKEGTEKTEKKETVPEKSPTKTTDSAPKITEPPKASKKEENK